MSDEKRMRELFDRLVAMSPEPPPFPEETTVARPATRRVHPILMFAGAAVAVLLLAAIPVYLLGGGNGEVADTTSTTTTVPTTETTAPETTTTTIEETTTTVPMAQVETVVYLTRSPENSNLGNPALVPFTIVVEAPEGMSPHEAALRALVSEGLRFPQGFGSSVPAGLEINSVSMSPADHLAVVDFGEAFLQGAGGLLSDFTMLNQLVFTVTQFGEVESVTFTVDGEPVEAFGSEGLGLTEPVDRGSFLDHVNLVIVDTPIQAGEGPLVVSGLANVFEATVSVEILDSSGEVVYQDFTTATCGTDGCGAYSFTVDYPFQGGETIRVYWNSAEDGEPSDVVAIPVATEPWDLLG